MSQHQARKTADEVESEDGAKSPVPPDRYTFGDNPLAADRLALLAATYEPSSARLLRLCASLSPRRATDLGCGPGYSTRLLHAMAAPAATLGLDRSAEHIARARALAPPGVEYALQDVTAPFGLGPRSDLLYCRFLLTHLREPAAALARWADAAADRAALVIEETMEISASHPALRLYYRLVGRLQRHYGQTLEIGRALDRAAIGSGWRLEIDLTPELRMPASRMARLHRLNLATWRDDPFARARFRRDTLDELETELEAIASGATFASDVRHSLRQLVLVRDRRR